MLLSGETGEITVIADKVCDLCKHGFFYDVVHWLTPYEAFKSLSAKPFVRCSMLPQRCNQDIKNTESKRRVDVGQYAYLFYLLCVSLSEVAFSVYVL